MYSYKITKRKLLSSIAYASIILSDGVNAQILFSGASIQPTSIIPADRLAITNWQNAGMRSLGGIPTRTTIYTTLSPLGGGSDDTSQINAALAACPAGQVVKLSAGAWTLIGPSIIRITTAVTLRGAGAGSTIITKSNGATPGSGVGAAPGPIILVGPQQFASGTDPANPTGGNFGAINGCTNLTADAVQGAFSVTVTSTSGFSAGQFVLLDELSNGNWQPDVTGQATSVWASSDYRVVWKKHNPNIPFEDFDAVTFPTTPNSNGDNWNRLDRANNEMKQISTIVGNVITFTSPIMLSYRTSNTAQLSLYTYTHLQGAGVESLSMVGGDGDNIAFNWCAYCWAKNIESSIWNGRGIEFNACFRCELRASYSHDAAVSQVGSGAYAIAFNYGSSEILVENCISVMTDKVMVAKAAGTGSVVGYNCMDDGFICTNGGWQEIGINGSHATGSHHILFEGNYCFNGDSDFTHGNNIYMTYFRNWLSGVRASFVNSIAYGGNGATVDDANNLPGGNLPLRCGAGGQYSNWFSYVGNVLGRSGAMSGWVYNDNTAVSKCVWAMGWDFIYPDPQCINTSFAGVFIRDGNYDFVTNSQKFEITPGGFTIPSSLYLTGKPAFFGSSPWPWVNPVTGATGPHSSSADLPALARLLNGTPNTTPNE